MSIPLRVKICGITREEDARLAAELGAWAVGFVFWPGSARFVDPQVARDIVRALPPFLTPVGVFVDQVREEIDAIAATVHLGAVQLHGDERPELARSLSHRVIKAVPLDAEGHARGLDEWPDTLVLLDAHDPVRRGGTGRPIDWDAAARIARQRPIVLAGGLTPDNVARRRRAGASDGHRRVVRRRVGARDQGSRTDACAVRGDRGGSGGGAVTLAREDPRAAVGRRDPDARGYFGAFGGRFVPETLVEPIEELERAYFRVRADAAFRHELDALLQHYVGRPTPLYEAVASRARPAARAHLPQARGPDAHRRAQDQQRARPGAARAAHGQAPRRRRDRRRPARRRDRDRLRAARARVRRLHGRRGHGAPGAQRVPHATARRDRAPRRRGQPHAQGRHQRGDARLGHERRATPTTCSARCSGRIPIR